MLPTFPEFKEIELSDRRIFEEAAVRFPRSACEYSFVNLFIWRDFDCPSFTSINGNICVLMSPQVGERFFLEPIGANDIPGTVEECLGYAGRISRASAELAESLNGNKARMNSTRDHFDYIYRTEDLALMKGRRFDAKRNHIKRLMRTFSDLEYSPLSRSDAVDALSLFDEWGRKKADAGMGEGGLSSIAVSCQHAALARLFESYDELRPVGGKVTSGGNMLGFIAGTATGGKQACVHFCYTRPGLSGVFSLLLKESCGEAFSPFEFVNLEQDLGIEGLRKNKLSFHPVRLEEKFEITAGES
ncbi:MAG TPA: phosphatidylglycerol lysyltransferase domain-containing protein [bacterium]|nr:phosphatidylglycerol lysyltransferase domain-containing protein [bacterium]